MSLKDLPLDMRTALSQKETPENRIIRAQLHLSDKWKVLGKMIVTDHPEFDDSHPDVPLPVVKRARAVSTGSAITSVEIESRYAGETTIYVAPVRRNTYSCPYCGVQCRPISYENRRYRHIDDIGHKCYIDVSLPKLICNSCGKTPQLRFPAADPNSRHTREFDREIVRKMRSESKSSLARDMEISTDVIVTALDRVIKRALINQDLSDTTGVFVDETQYGSGQDYISVFANQRHKVIFICRGHGKEALELFRDHLIIQGGDPECIRVFSADMSRAYESGVLENFPNATLVWDRFQCDRKRTNEGLSERTSPSVWGDSNPTCVG